MKVDKKETVIEKVKDVIRYLEVDMRESCFHGCDADCSFTDERKCGVRGSLISLIKCLEAS